MSCNYPPILWGMQTVFWGSLFLPALVLARRVGVFENI